MYHICDRYRTYFLPTGGLGLDISMVQEASSSEETQENTTQQQKPQESQDHAK